MRQPSRTISIILALAMLLCASAETLAQRKSKRAKSKPTTERTIESVRKEKEANRREIRETGRQISDNQRLTALQLDSLENCRRHQADLQGQIAAIQQQITSTDRAIAAVNDTIGQLERRCERLTQAYRAMMHKMQGERRSTSRLAFIMSAQTFKQAWQRVRYVKQFASWQQMRAKELRQARAELDQRRLSLEKLKRERAAKASTLAAARTSLAQQEARQQVIVAELKRHGADLREVLQAKEQRAQQLDRELDRLIAAEQARIERERQEQLRRERELLAERKRREKERQAQAERDRQAAQASSAPGSAGGKSAKPAKGAPAEKPAAPAAAEKPMLLAETDRKLSGSFASNRGRLLFPVTGSYRITRGFGKQRHPDMPHVTTENNGIDIETAAGASARAVFAGRVASILQVPGYNYIIMVRHGDYLTVYSGLNKPLVRKDQEVTAGQPLAPVMASPDRAGRGMLHFELRHNSRKYNPLEWVK